MKERSRGGEVVVDNCGRVVMGDFVMVEGRLYLTGARDEDVDDTDVNDSLEEAKENDEDVVDSESESESESVSFSASMQASGRDEGSVMPSPAITAGRRVRTDMTVSHRRDVMSLEGALVSEMDRTSVDSLMSWAQMVNEGVPSELTATLTHFSETKKWRS